MAVATSFRESDRVLDKPSSMDRDDCEALSVLGILVDLPSGDKCPAVVSCWKLTDEEMAEVIKTRRIWVTVFGSNMPPVAINGNKYFGEPE